MTDITPEALRVQAEATLTKLEQRANANRLGKSTMREMDAYILAIREAESTIRALLASVPEPPTERRAQVLRERHHFEVAQENSQLRAAIHEALNGGPSEPGGFVMTETPRRILTAALEATAGITPPTEEQWEYGITWDPDVTEDPEPQSFTGCETEEGAWAVGRNLAYATQATKVWRRRVPKYRAPAPGPWEPVEAAARVGGGA